MISKNISPNIGDENNVDKAQANQDQATSKNISPNIGDENRVEAKSIQFVRTLVRTYLRI